MSDGDALLRAILEHPAEDTPRLMYADWLQENGRHAGELRARFIRDQVWLWANPSCGSCTGPEWSAGKFCPECREREERRGRTAVELFGRERWLEWSRPANLCVPGGALWDDHVQFVRGFVCEICCPLAAFMHHAEALFRAHPIERVTLTDRRPLRFTPDAGSASFDWPDRFAWIVATDWQLPGPDSLPRDLWEHLEREAYSNRSKRYDTESEALAGLSDACVAYGRSLAGLAPLPDVANHAPNHFQDLFTKCAHRPA